MLSSAALRARVACVIDAMSRTAVAEIAKVVEEGMMALRLEVCEQESEINKLKGDIELLRVELSAAREGVELKLRAERRRRDGSSGDKEHNTSGPEFQVKTEPVDELSGESGGRTDRLGAELALREGGIGKERSNSLNADLTGLDDARGLQPGPFSRGRLGRGRLQKSNGAVQKKGYICPYCGKCFERAGHLQRHKRIHTGEKPHRCEMCGRCFSQKCSLKEHMKIHNRCAGPRPVEIPAREDNQELVSDAHHAEACSHSGLANPEDGAPAAVQVKSEPAEQSVAQTLSIKKETEAPTQRFGSCSPQRANAEMSGAEYPGSSGQTAVAPADSPCSTVSFPGNGSASQTPCGSSASGSRGTADASGRSDAFEMLKPKKCFVCSHCSKAFVRSGHLERHLRIHTGEKPYGCHICGRCFNQNSSLKGHMRTHKKCDATDVQPLRVTAPDRQPSEPAFSHRVPGSWSSAGVGSGPGASAQAQLVTRGTEQGSSVSGQAVCVLLQDVQRLSPANELQGYALACLPFGTDRELMQTGHVQGNVAGTLRDELVSQEVAASDDDQAAAGQKHFICSHCRQSFQTFSSFETHQCKNAEETLFTCEICDEAFNHLSLLTLHLKLHTARHH